jgi:predicted O-methyltransferase YrrM
MMAAAARMLRLLDQAITRWHFPVVGRAKGRLLRRLLARHRPRRAVEIGSLFGYSAILIASELPPGGRLVSVEANPFLAWMVQANVREAGLGGRVTVRSGDARRVIPTLRDRFDFALIDAAKTEYLDYLRRLEPRLRPGAVVVADNTGIFRRDVAPYLRHVRESGRYQTREYRFGADAMEVSILAPPPSGPVPRRGRG